jgi:uncharacterized cofD-like protein
MKKVRKKIVCFGGGTGLSSLLSGLRHSPFFDITAIVTMFDNGRSSGELRDRFGILPPGDIMKCMVALASNPQAARELLTKRIERDGRAPHSAGNMLLMGIEKVYGDYYEAIKAFGEILAITGHVIPVSVHPSTLCAELSKGEFVEGQVAVGTALRTKALPQRIFLKPSVKAFPAAIAAIKKADVIVIGPGSFYESILSNFLPTGVSVALKKSKAPIIYVANLLTEGSAMDSRLPITHWVKIAESYVGRRFNKVIINKSKPTPAVRAAYEKEGKHPLLWTPRIVDRRFIPADIWLDPTIARHDPAALTWAITSATMQLLK